VQLYRCDDSTDQSDWELVEDISIASSNAFGYADWVVPDTLVQGQPYAVKVSGERVRFAINTGSASEEEFGFFPALFGQRVNPESDIEADIVEAAPYNGCTAFTNGAAVAGKIAMVERGGDCFFTEKVANAMTAGAIAVVVVNTANQPFFMGAPNDGVDYSNYIPSISVTRDTGIAVDNALGNNNNVPALIGTLVRYNHPFIYSICCIHPSTYSIRYKSPSTHSIQKYFSIFRPL
jgi:hypothetical protein